MEPTETGRLLSGRYRLAAVIGRGGMGVVWRARDELLNRDVAVKELIWPPHLTEPELQAACSRAVREARLAGRLTHLNVVRIYDILQENGHPWIIMELLPYHSLRDLVLEEGPLAPVYAARVGVGVLAALRAAHAEGILHRDVKPGNILVGRDGRVILTDFGIAWAIDGPTLTAASALAGSPSYVAPERAKGGQSSPAGDLWGLGASLYTTVEGHPPFERNTPLATLTAVVIDEPEEAVHAGPLWPVISGLLRKDPDERLDMAQTERMLLEIVNGRVAQSSPAAPHRTTTELVAEEPMAALPAAEPTAAPAPDPAADVPPVRVVHRRPRRAALALAAVAVIGTAIALAVALSPGRLDASPTASATSTAAASRASAGYGTLPSGYYRFTNSTGFSIGVPDSWRISHVSQYVYVTDPSNSGIFLLIDQSDTPSPDPLADWQQQAASRAGTYPGYHLIRLESVSYPQAEKAADWEFTFVRNGVLVHILNRNVLANASHAYALYWSAPASDWNAYYHYFQAFAATFRPAS